VRGLPQEHDKPRRLPAATGSSISPSVTIRLELEVAGVPLAAFPTTRIVRQLSD
jgi:hypothetical protein